MNPLAIVPILLGAQVLEPIISHGEPHPEPARPVEARYVMPPISVTNTAATPAFVTTATIPANALQAGDIISIKGRRIE
jgi:hypothetical protein